MNEKSGYLDNWSYQGSHLRAQPGGQGPSSLARHASAFGYAGEHVYFLKAPGGLQVAFQSAITTPES